MSVSIHVPTSELLRFAKSELQIRDSFKFIGDYLKPSRDRKISIVTSIVTVGRSWANRVLGTESAVSMTTADGRAMVASCCKA